MKWGNPRLTEADRELARVRRQLERELYPPRWRWHYLIPVLALFALLWPAWLAYGPRGEAGAVLAQVYRLEDGATRVDLTVYNTGRGPLAVGPGNVTLLDDHGQTWAVPPGEVVRLEPGASQPLTVMGALPATARVAVVVVVIAGTRAPVELVVGAHHRRGEWE
jgi:hypothetical protein